MKNRKEGKNELYKRLIRARGSRKVELHNKYVDLYGGAEK